MHGFIFRILCVCVFCAFSCLCMYNYYLISIFCAFSCLRERVYGLSVYMSLYICSYIHTMWKNRCEKERKRIDVKYIYIYIIMLVFVGAQSLLMDRGCKLIREKGVKNVHKLLRVQVNKGKNLKALLRVQVIIRNVSRVQVNIKKQYMSVVANTHNNKQTKTHNNKQTNIHKQQPTKHITASIYCIIL